MINQKFLYALTASALLASTALADGSGSKKSFFFRDNESYLRVDIGKSYANKVNDGENYTHNKLHNPHILYNLGVGKYFDKGWRGDVSFSDRRYKIGDSTVINSFTYNHHQKITSQALMLNGYYDFKNFTSFTPYLNAGIGMSRNKAGSLVSADTTGSTSLTYGSHTIHDFAWQLGAGAFMEINKNINLDLSYKYINLGDLKTRNGVSNNGDIAPSAHGKLRTHEWMIGMRYNF